MRVGWAVVACVLAACSAPADNPRPSRTLEPSVTESSAKPEPFVPSEACKLLTSEEREEVGRISMDAEVPVRAIEGTQECVWTHSRTQPARSAIRVIASNGQTWIKAARPQLIRAIAHPATSKSLGRKLKAALDEIASGKELTDERICEMYLLFAESRGMHRSEDMLFAGAIGSMPAVYAASCDQGTVIMAGFGEYGLRGSIALSHAVFRLVEAANARAPEVLGGTTTDDQDGTATEDDAGDEDASPGPEPSATEPDEGDTDNEDTDNEDES
jgi:hypothetical protein